MSEPIQDPSPAQASRPSGGPIDFILSLLSSLKFALSVVVLIALACIAGTVIPQGAQVAPYLARHPGAHGIMQVLSMTGLTRVFYSWWFVMLLFVLAASLTVCTGRRYAMIGRTKGAVRARVIGSFITHVSLLLVLAGGVVRVLWSQKGTIQFHEGETADRVASPDGSFPLPFAVRLAKFELEFYKTPVPPTGDQIGALLVQWPERKLRAEFPVELKVEHPLTLPDTPAGAEPAFTVSVIRYVADFARDNASGEVMSRSDAPNNPAVLVSVTGAGGTNLQWVFANFPDFASHEGPDGAAAPLPLKFQFAAAPSPSAMGRESAPIKAFKSTLEVLENGAVVSTRTIAVNAPYSYGGYTFYQLSYDPQDLTWSMIQVVQEPSVPIVYGGFVLMMVGLTVVFCVGPWLDTQRRPTGGIS